MLPPSSPFPERQSFPSPPSEILGRDPLQTSPSSWWRHGNIPLIALVTSGFTADFMFGTLEGPGIGTALGILLYTGAFLLLRTDLGRKERLFLIFMALVNAVATGANLSPNSHYNLLIVMFLPVGITFIPREEGNPYDPSTKYVSWWGYKFFRMNQARQVTNGLKGKLPLAASIVIGLVLFIFFLSLFADGNPVVAAIKTAMSEWIRHYCSWLVPDFGTLADIFLWIMGAFSFGILARHRPCSSFEKNHPVQPGKPLLPSLPAISLLFINLAFLVNNGTDMAFLWRGNVPDGISQTAYLHDGADSIMLAAFFSALILLILFRPDGSVRASKTGTFLGFFLTAQTGLLAASVAMRLYYQIEDFGFSPNRVTAIICLLMGTFFLYLLFRYMAGKGNLMRYSLHCGALTLVFLALTGWRSPSQLSGDLNLLTMDDHPDWYFSDADLPRFEKPYNLPFSMAVYQRLGSDTEAGANVYAMIRENIIHVSPAPLNWRSRSLWEKEQERRKQEFHQLPVPTVTATYGTTAWKPSFRPTGMRSLR